MMNQEEVTSEETPIAAFFQNKQTTSCKRQEEERDIELVFIVKEAPDDRVSDTFIMLNVAGITSVTNGLPEDAQGRPAEQIKQENASDDRPVKRKRNKRSLIWRHFEQPDGLAYARCCICMKSLPFEGCGTGNLYRHLSGKHPEVFSQLAADRQHLPPRLASQSSNVKVAVVPEDGEYDNLKSTMDGILDCAGGGLAEQNKQEQASDDLPMKCRQRKRSLIWRHFEQLDGLASARCSICMKLMSFEGGGTGNLHRHLSRMHPKVFSQLAADQQCPPPPHSSQNSDVNDDTLEGLLKASNGEERRLFRKAMGALRRAQPEEFQELEHQRELLEELRAVNAREAAAEREQIDSLRAAQLEEAKDLSQQREEVQMVKAALLEELEELQKERARLLILDIHTKAL
ncbi:uncharacterized protein [Clinocottus analis]|uniref:uncharacterized protein n=1 Tax=Clinocottus analis TaxID=304258 RepID=UPI0035BFC530